MSLLSFVFTSSFLFFFSFFRLFSFYFFFFFFQAEDGIRDRDVTGVQTCALPIYTEPLPTCACLRTYSGPGGTWPHPRCGGRWQCRSLSASPPARGAAAVMWRCCGRRLRKRPSTWCSSSRRPNRWSSCRARGR